MSRGYFFLAFFAFFFATVFSHLPPGLSVRAGRCCTLLVSPTCRCGASAVIARFRRVRGLECEFLARKFCSASTSPLFIGRRAEKLQVPDAARISLLLRTRDAQSTLREVRGARAQ